MGKVQSTIEGVTTSSYSGNTLKFPCSHNEIKSIAIRNGDASLALTYKVIAYFDASEKVSKKIQAETDLLATEIDTHMVNEVMYDHITVYLKTKVTTCSYYVVQNFK